MLISYRWLQRHVDLTGISPEEVARLLTTHTAEVEGVERFAPWLDDVVVGHVVERERHPDADKLSVCKVDVGPAGDGELLTIVCGAPNVDAGQRVAIARIGTVLPGDLKIKKAKIRGQESRGMICSVRELELGDDHSGIWVLPPDVELGSPVARAVGLEDWVLEIDNKSITHRPDLWGHRGIAAELCALRGLELAPLDLTLPATEPGAPYPVRVETPGCPRYLGLPIDGVVNGPAPEWLRHLLLAVGQRPLDLLVDLSNFVMLDLGQPNHLFDRERLSDQGILVRDARPGERMATLDEVERVFTDEDMLICSGDEPVAVAGVMGGELSKVLPTTSRLLLEAAAFHPTLVRRTALRLGLRTDASARFEKHLDPTLPAKAAAHLVALLRELQPDIRLPRPAGDAGTWRDPAHEVELRPARVRAVLGVDVQDARIEAVLSALGFVVTRGEPWRVGVSSARATKDVALEEDLIEEVGRTLGYDTIPERRLEGVIAPPAHDERRLLVRRLQERLAKDARFHEALTYSFQSDELLASLGADALPHVRLVNPVVESDSRVRRDVLPSLLGALARNRRHCEDVRLFEVGKGYRPEDANERGEPREVHQVALAWARPPAGAGARFDEDTFARLRGVVEDLVLACGRDPRAWTWRRGDAEAAPGWAHPGRHVVAERTDGRDPCCVLGVLEPGLRRELGLAGELESDVACATLSLDELLSTARTPSSYRPLPRFPGVKVDVAVALAADTPAATVAAAIERAGKGLVADIELFDLYRGESLGAGRKSLAYHVLLQAADKTLSDKETARFLARLERGLAEAGAELRKE